MITLTYKTTAIKLYPLKLVQSKTYKDVVVMVTQDFRSICLPHQFMGVYLAHSCKDVLGKIAKLNKEDFEPFNGTITIEN